MLDKPLMLFKIQIMKKTILIVDDDPAIVTLEQQILTKNGYGVLCAYSGTEALLLLKEHTPDVILLDLMLPGIIGEDTYGIPHGTA